MDDRYQAVDLRSGKNGEVNTFPTIDPPSRNYLSFPEYRLTEDDWVHVIYESPGIGGYYSETGRIFYFREPCDDAKRVWDETVKLLEYQTTLLKPGKTLHEIRRETNDYLRSIGAAEDTNIFMIRGIGNLTVDRPQLFDWDQMKLQPNMALSLQPRYRKDGQTSIALDTYVVTEGKPYKFSRVPQELVVFLIGDFFGGKPTRTTSWGASVKCRRSSLPDTCRLQYSRDGRVVCRKYSISLRMASSQ